MVSPQSANIHYNNINSFNSPVIKRQILQSKEKQITATKNKLTDNDQNNNSISNNNIHHYYHNKQSPYSLKDQNHYKIMAMKQNLQNLAYQYQNTNNTTNINYTRNTDTNYHRQLSLHNYSYQKQLQSQKNQNLYTLMTQQKDNHYYQYKHNDFDTFNQKLLMMTQKLKKISQKKYFSPQKQKNQQFTYNQFEKQYQRRSQNRNTYENLLKSNLLQKQTKRDMKKSTSKSNISKYSQDKSKKNKSQSKSKIFNSQVQSQNRNRSSTAFPSKSFTKTQSLSKIGKINSQSNLNLQSKMSLSVNNPRRQQLRVSKQQYDQSNIIKNNNISRIYKLQLIQKKQQFSQRMFINKQGQKSLISLMSESQGDNKLNINKFLQLKMNKKKVKFDQNNFFKQPQNYDQSDHRFLKKILKDSELETLNLLHNYKNSKIKSFKFLKALNLHRHKITSLKFIKNSSFNQNQIEIVTSSLDYSVKLTKIKFNKQKYFQVKFQIKQFRRHRNGVQCIQIINNHQNIQPLIISGGREGILRYNDNFYKFDSSINQIYHYTNYDKESLLLILKIDKQLCLFDLQKRKIINKLAINKNQYLLKNQQQQGIRSFVYVGNQHRLGKIDLREGTIKSLNMNNSQKKMAINELIRQQDIVLQWIILSNKIITKIKNDSYQKIKIYQNNNQRVQLKKQIQLSNDIESKNLLVMEKELISIYEDKKQKNKIMIKMLNIDEDASQWKQIELILNSQNIQENSYIIQQLLNNKNKIRSCYLQNQNEIQNKILMIVNENINGNVLLLSYD